MNETDKEFLKRSGIRALEEYPPSPNGLMRLHSIAEDRLKRQMDDLLREKEEDRVLWQAAIARSQKRERVLGLILFGCALLAVYLAARR
jgi:hypothetical protein